MATLFETAMRGYGAADQMIRESRAYQAARAQYGEKAGDPGLFSALQQQDLAEKRDARADEQLKLQQDANRRANAAEGRAAETHGINVGSTQDNRKKDAILNLVEGLRQARDQGQDLGEAFDALADTLPGLGVSEEDLPAMREQLLENPDILDQYYESLKPSLKGKSGAAANKEANKADRANKARNDVDRTINAMRDAYNVLDEQDAIVNPDEGALRNIGARLSQSGPGRLVAGAMGTKAESARRTIEGLRPSLIAAMKAAEEMGAKMFDSQRDMELWLATVSDPTQDLATVTTLLDEFQEKYGNAMAGEDIVPIVTENTTESEDYKRSNGTGRDEIYIGFKDPVTGLVFQGGDPSDEDNWQDSGSGR